MSGMPERPKSPESSAADLPTVAEGAAPLAREHPAPGQPAALAEPRGLRTVPAEPESPDKQSRFRTIDPQVDFVGHTIDQKYHLERLLGEGGMGAVYRATHLGTGRCVAVKLIAPQFMQDRQFVERFQREARAAGRLRHPNIVDVTDFGIAPIDGVPVAYLVMEYLDGRSLSDVLAEAEPLPLGQVVEILEQTCSAVHEAHQKGIVHRDLKPANIWLEPNPLGGFRVKVLDFGIAKLADAREDAATGAGTDKSEGTSPLAGATTSGSPPTPGASRTPPPPPPDAAHPTQRLPPATPSSALTSRLHQEPLTQAGALLGTPAYMSPEQCRGEQLDGRSDVYSLGIIAYQMLSGSLPFSGDATTLVDAHQSLRPPPLAAKARNLPKPVARWVMAALAKKPADRPQSARAFGQAFRAHAEGLGALYRKSMALYSEYFPIVIRFSILAHIPVLMVVLLSLGSSLFDPHQDSWIYETWDMFLSLMRSLSDFAAGTTISGLTAVMVVDLAETPLRPIQPGSILERVKQRLRPLFKTGFLASIWIILGGMLLIIPAFVLMVRFVLWAPVVLLEGLEMRAALRRSRELASRSWRTCILAVAFQLCLPMVAQFLANRLIQPHPISKDSLAATWIPEVAGLTGILVTPWVSIVLALVYLKARRLGG